MSKQTDIVNVAISRDTSTLSKAAFGYGMALTVTHNLKGLRIKPYSNADDVLDDFDTTSPEYLSAVKYFSPNIAPDLFYIATVAVDSWVAMVTDAIEGNTYVLDFAINSETFSYTYTALSGDTVNDIGQALYDLMAADVDFSALFDVTFLHGAQLYGSDEVDVTNAFTIEVKVSETVWGVTAEDSTGTIIFGDGVWTETYAKALAAILKANSNWYAFGFLYRDDDITMDLAAWTEAADVGRAFFYSTGNPDCVDPLKTDDIMSALQALSYDRSIGIFHHDASYCDGVDEVESENDPYAEFAWMGRMLPTDLDQTTATWKFKTLVGVPVDSLTTTEYTTLRGTGPDCSGGKNGNAYIEVGGTYITIEGKVASGEFIDTIMGIDWLVARMTEKIYAPLVANDKVPFDDDGISLIELQIRTALGNGLATKFFRFDADLGSQGFQVIVPLVGETDVTDRGNRYLKEITFQARLAGAVHAVYVAGRVTV